ncbi:hypothetical protein [Streptomyces oceani]|uniref:hypothetical protein n=1 Tax=Streptomyces oceani TaxID=1075402 RepID=UPI0008722545|nr:hypothetical protein [Streptomyces oceani]
MLDEAEGAEWVSHRCADVRRPLDRLGIRSAAGVPCVAPEVQLSYMPERPRSKDELDFARTLPVLRVSQRRRPARALKGAYGHHPWHGPLGSGTPARGAGGTVVG